MLFGKSRSQSPQNAFIIPIYTKVNCNGVLLVAGQILESLEK